jgi:hypothetical protein
MEEVFFPIIRPKDYDAFWRLTNGDLPDTYEEWREQYSKSKAERARQGAVVIDVEVYPEDFATFCKKSDLPPSTEILIDFAEEEARRQCR